MQILQHFWVVNVALTAALGVVSAQTVAGTIARELDTLPPPPAPAGRVVAPAAQEPRPAGGYGVIVERNLFNSKNPGGVVETVPVSRSAAAAPTPLPPLNARLIGTVLGAGDGYAIIEDSATRRQELYRLNERVMRDAKLIAIERDRVKLARAGRTEVLELAFVERPGSAAPAPPPVVAAEPPRPGGGVAQVGENRYVVDQRELDAAFENMNQLLTQARMVPYFNAGRADGFRIFAIRPNSLFEKIGLRDGDVLQRVNGAELTGPEKALELFEQLKNEKSITVDLVRNNVKQTLSYEIR